MRTRQPPLERFMPGEEHKTPAVNEIIGRLMDTINAMRDVAHIIWNT
jgi:hypothetical protein